MIDLTQVTALRNFRISLPEYDINSNEEFRRMFFRAKLLLELSELEMADALRVSKPTIHRWIEGKSLLHRALRPAIVKWIEREILLRIT